METQPPTLRERKKAATRATVLRVAHGFFGEKGYSATTVDEICAEAVISKRTFFRYFPDKESLVFPNRVERLEDFVGFLEAGAASEEPFATLRRATRLFGFEYGRHKVTLLARQRLVMSSPSLVAREAAIDRDWERAIARIFAVRLAEVPDGGLWSRVLAGAIIGVVRATMTCWFESDCEDDLVRLGLNAIDFLERGFPAVTD
jgi:AcrR family transcriptional regulator